jgi:hypothetical protein
MAYRDDAESLRAYRDRITSELADARRGAEEARERAQNVRKLERDLAETEAKLAALDASGGRPRRALEDVRIAAPCTASWDDMKGDDRVRFCGKCEKNVYNLSAMPREEAEAFLADRGGNVCVRLYQRTDGTVLTEDCPVGVKRRRRVRLALAVGGGLLAGAAVAIAGMDGKCKTSTDGWQQGDIRPLQGAVAFPLQSATQEPSAETPPPRPPVQPIMGKPTMPHPAGTQK